MNSWLPHGVPVDVMRWPFRWIGPHGINQHAFALYRGALAYELRTISDGRAVEILEWVDGIKTRQWRRASIDDAWDFTWKELYRIEDA